MDQLLQVLLEEVLVADAKVDRVEARELEVSAGKAWQLDVTALATKVSLENFFLKVTVNGNRFDHFLWVIVSHKAKTCGRKLLRC